MTIQYYWFFGPESEPKSEPKPESEPVQDHARASPLVRQPKQTLKLFREEPGMTRASDYHHNNQRVDHPTQQFLALTLYLEASNDGHKSKKKCGGRGGASKRVGVIDGPSPAPGIPEALRRRIEGERGGRNVRLILQKRLYRSDTDPNENRLSMPEQQLAPGDFLSAEEEAECCRRASGDCGRIVGSQAGLIVEPHGGGSGGVRIATVGLKKWDYKGSSSYVLCGNWKDIVAENGLEVGEVIQVWFFRDVHAKPCFALVNLGK